MKDTKESILAQELKREAEFHEIPHQTQVGDYIVIWYPVRHRTTKRVPVFFGLFSKVEEDYIYHYQCTVSGPDGTVRACFEDYQKEKTL